MAASGASTPTNTKTKREVTPEQKRLYALLGVAGLLALGVGVIYGLPLLSGSPAPAPATAVTTTTTTTTTEPTPSAGAVGESGVATAGVAGAVGPNGAGAVGIAAAPATGAAPANAAAFGVAPRHRDDPFQPFVILTTATPEPPPPTPRPAPTPQPPVPVPLPPADVPFSVPLPNGRSIDPIDRQPLALPGVVIPRINSAVRAPRDAFPPPRVSGGTDGGGSTDPQPSFDKRLSGVIISNGVRAILEVSSPTGPKSYIVQPGDTVEGVTVLNIQRFSEGTRTITRMLVREGGQERYIDLKAGAALQGPAGAEGAGRIPGGFQRPGAGRTPGGFGGQGQP